MSNKDDKAKRSIATVFGEDEVEIRFKELTKAQDKEMEDGVASWEEMTWPSGSPIPSYNDHDHGPNQPGTHGVWRDFCLQVTTFGLPGFGATTARVHHYGELCSI